MLTREWLLREMARSEALEEQTYRELTLSLFQGLQAPLKALYDQMIAATRRLTEITPEALQANPGIVKILRYCLAPIISQMRLGQIVGLRSTDIFERETRNPTREQAARLANWFRLYLDKERFPWLASEGPPLSDVELRIAEHYAKLCTVSLVSNQNTDTEYRNRRKDRQERAIAEALRRLGLVLQEALGPPAAPRQRRPRGSPPAPPPRRAGGIRSLDDVRPGHYVLEKKILPGPGKKQKADLTARPHGDRLFCIEAKAVGIRLDSTKRLKELNDKYTDWLKSGLPITTVGVCAGFFNAVELVATVRGRQIPIFFEHDLDRLVEFLGKGIYYDLAWNPSALFPDVPAEEVATVLEQIQQADAAEPVEASDSSPADQEGV